MMFPILYEKGETIYTHLGMGYLKDTVSCIIKEQANGTFELNMEYPVSGFLSDHIDINNYIKAKPNAVDDPHVFRINEIDKDREAGIYTITASSITDDLNGTFLKYSRTVDLPPQVALDEMKKALVEPTRFRFWTNITTNGIVEWKNRNALSCIVGQEGSIIDVYGGEIKRLNEGIWIYKRRGKDRVTVIRAKKNLKGFTLQTSFLGKYTKIMPYFTYSLPIPNSAQSISKGEDSTPSFSTEDQEFEFYGEIVESDKSDDYPEYVRRLVHWDMSDYKPLQEYIKEQNDMLRDLAQDTKKDIRKAGAEAKKRFDDEQKRAAEARKDEDKRRKQAEDDAKFKQREDEREDKWVRNAQNSSGSRDSKKTFDQKYSDYKKSRAHREDEYEKRKQQKAAKASEAEGKRQRSAEERKQRIYTAMNLKKNAMRDTLNSRADQFAREVAEARIRIEQKAQDIAMDYFSKINPGCDEPNVKMDIDLLQISESVDERKYIEHVNLFDTVQVYIPEYNINVDVKIIELHYDPLKSRTTKLVAGNSNFRSLSEGLKAGYTDLRKKMGDLQDFTEAESKRLEQIILTTADGKNSMYSGMEEPTGNLKEGDIWWKDVGGGDVEMWRWDGFKWIRVTYAGMGEDIKQFVEETIDELSDLFDQQDRDQTERLDAAITDIGYALDSAEEAKNVAKTVQQDVENAIEASNNAVAAAQDAVNSASGRITDMESQITSTINHMSNLRESLGNEQERITTELTNIEGRVNSKISQVKQDIDGTISEVLTEVGESVNSVRQSFRQTYAGLEDTINQQHAEIVKNAASIQSSLGTINATQAEIDSFRTNLQVLSGVIDTKLTRDQVNKLVDDRGYLTTSSASTLINQSYEGIRQELSTVKSKIPAEIGGRNYIPDYNFKKSYYDINKVGFLEGDEWEFQGVLDATAPGEHAVKARLKSGTSKGLFINVLDILVPKFRGKQVTESIYVKTNSSHNLEFIGFESGGLDSNYQITRGWKRFSKTFIVEANSENSNRFILKKDKTPFVAGDVIYFSGLQLEMGSILTDVKPALEDTISDLESMRTVVNTTSSGVTQLTQKVNQTEKSLSTITTEVQNLSGSISDKISRSEINKLDDKYLKLDTYNTLRQQDEESFIERISRTASNLSKRGTNLIKHGRGGTSDNLESLSNQVTSTNWTWNNWLFNTGGTIEPGKYNSNQNDSESGYYISTKNLTGEISTNAFEIKPNTNYTLFFKIASPDTTIPFTAFLRTKLSGGETTTFDILANSLAVKTQLVRNTSGILPKYGQNEVSITFNSGSGHSGQGYIVFKSRIPDNTSQSRVHIVDACLVEGDYNESWIPSSDDFVTKSEFHETKSTVNSFSRIISGTDKDGVTNLAKQLMGTDFMINEIAKVNSANENLIVDAMEFRKVKWVGPLIEVTGKPDPTIWSSGIIPNDDLGGKIYFTSKYKNSSTTHTHGVKIPVYLKEVRKGDKFTVRFDYITDNDVADPKRSDFFVQFGKIDVAGGISWTQQLTPSRSWASANYTFTVPNNIYNMSIENGDGLFFYHTKSDGITIRNLMLVKGDTIIGGFKPNSDEVYMITGDISALRNEMTVVKTRVSQTSNSWAVKNLTSANTIVSQINVNPAGVRIQGKNIQLDGNTSISNGVIKNAHIADGSISNAKIADASINNAKITSMDVDKLTGNTANWVKLKVKDAIIDMLKGKVIESQAQSKQLDTNAYKPNMQINLNTGWIEFGASNAGIKRYMKRNGNTAFLHFNDADADHNGSTDGLYVGLGVTSGDIGVKSGGHRKNGIWIDDTQGRFAGVRIFRAYDNSKVDQIELYGDKVVFSHGFGAKNDFVVDCVKLDKAYDMTQVINVCKFLAHAIAHLQNVGGDWGNPAFSKSLLGIWNQYGMNYFFPISSWKL